MDLHLFGLEIPKPFTFEQTGRNVSEVAAILYEDLVGRSSNPDAMRESYLRDVSIRDALTQDPIGINRARHVLAYMSSSISPAIGLLEICKDGKLTAEDLNRVRQAYRDRHCSEEFMEEIFDKLLS